MNENRTTTHWKARGTRLAAGALAALAAVVLAPVATPILEGPLAGTKVVEAVRVIGASSAEAQWGMARRSGRRGGRRAARRTSRRQDYLYGAPVESTTVVVAGTPYQQVGEAYYEPVMVEGRVAYAPANVTP